MPRCYLAIVVVSAVASSAAIDLRPHRPNHGDDFRAGAGLDRAAIQYRQGASRSTQRFVVVPPTLPVALGAELTCVLTTDGIYCWGGNDRGQVGIGSTLSQPTPRFVPVACP